MKNKIEENNIMLAVFMYGEPEENHYKIGYKQGFPLFRNKSELATNYYINFHNDWNILMDVISRIAKDPVEDFSKEDILIQHLKNILFDESYNIIAVWETVCKIVKLKLTI